MHLIYLKYLCPTGAVRYLRKLETTGPLSALTTLSNLHTILGIPNEDTQYDALLNLYISEVSAVIYEYLKIKDFITSFYSEVYSGNNRATLILKQTPVVATPFTGTLTQNSPVITNVSATTNLFVNQTVLIPGLANGFYITGIGSNTVTLNQPSTITVTNQNFYGTIAVWLDENANFGDSANAFLTTPTIGVATTILSEGSDYCLDWGRNPPELCKTGILSRINYFWPGPYMTAGNLITPLPGPQQGNIKVQYNAGYSSVPLPVQAAAELLIAKIRQSRMWGVSPSSLKMEDAQITMPSSQLYGFLNGEISALLSPYKEIVLGTF